jgi:hypothetical protein
MRRSRRLLQVALSVALIGMFLPVIRTHPGIALLSLSIPALAILACYLLITYGDASLKPLEKWLGVAFFIMMPIALFGDRFLSNLVLQAIAGASFLSVVLLMGWIGSRSKFETMTEGRLKARFTVPSRVRVNVQNVEGVAPWYMEKLGLRCKNPCPVPGYLSLSFKKDGNPILLVPPDPLRYPSYPMLYTESLEDMREILIQRGIKAGAIAPDRQGTRTFEVHDPENNVIDVVAGWGLAS